MKFAERVGKVKKSYIREILKVTQHPEVISFAGGLPNPDTFPVNEISKASQKVLESDGKNVLQYSTTEGYEPLRQYICDRYYKRYKLKVDPSEILITTGSQQALDLIGKVFLDKEDSVVIEKPGYLGAIQSLSVFEPNFVSVTLEEDGICIKELKEAISKYNPKLYYAVTNFQNPSGLTYSQEKLENVAEILKDTDTIMIADDPYGELRYSGEEVPSIRNFIKENSILLGSFSKIAAPGLRLGWVCANHEIMDKLITAKQAADLHTSYFSQRVLYQYLIDNDLDEHIAEIRELYKNQQGIMLNTIKEYFPPEVKFTSPEGGMFLWVTLPEGISALSLLDECAKANVAFVPGDPFYVDTENVNTMRLNYTNSTEEEIVTGIKRLASVIKKRIEEQRK